MRNSDLRLQSRRRRGFTLVEMAIVLAVAALLFAGLWRLMSGGSQQMRDQSAADLQKQLISAIQGYLGSGEGQTFVAALPGLTTAQINLPAVAGNCAALTTPTLCNYLPSGFSNGTINSYGQKYLIQVRKDSPEAGGLPAASYSFMIMTTIDGDTIPDTSGGRISGMIGNDGGFIYSTDICNAQADPLTANSACGAYGSWAFSVATYGFGGGASGRIASRTSVVSGADSNIWLARVQYPFGSTPPSDYNTMHTDLYLGGNHIYGGSDIATPTPLGTIENLRQIYVGVPFGAASIGNPTITAGASCDSASHQLTLPAVCGDTAIQANGDVNITGKLTAYYFIYNTLPSDMRLKFDIKPLEHSLEDLSKIRALSFSMNDTKEKKLGVIAQEVEKVYPELVHDIGNGYKGVDYMGFIGPLVGAVQELKTENEELKGQLKEQARAIKQLQRQAPTKK